VYYVNTYNANQWLAGSAVADVAMQLKSTKINLVTHTHFF